MKKKLIFACIGLLSYGASFAQIKKGTWLAEGSIGNIYLQNSGILQNVSNGQYSSKQRSMGISLVPRAGLFLSDRVCVGTGLHFSGEYLKYEEVDHLHNRQILVTNAHRFGVIPFVRYYFGAAPARLRFYLMGEVSYDWGISKSKASSKIVNITWSSGESSHVSSNIGAALGVGLNYFVSDNVALNSAIAYHYMSWLPPASNYHQWRLNWGFGFSFFLCGKKSEDISKRKE